MAGVKVGPGAVWPDAALMPVIGCETSLRHKQKEQA